MGRILAFEPASRCGQPLVNLLRFPQFPYGLRSPLNLQPQNMLYSCAQEKGRSRDAKMGTVADFGLFGVACDRS
jgi:hypothetical protein